MGASREGQSILDYAIQEFGDVSNAIDVIQAAELSLTDEIAAGTDLELDTENKGERSIKDFYNKQLLTPNNAAPIELGQAYSSAYSNGYN